jgi:hypothetical protein
MTLSAACTIICSNYLAFAKALASSFKRHNPTASFYVLVVDGDDAFVNNATDSDAEFIPLDHIGIPDVRSMAFSFSALEMSTNVKPFFMKYLLNEKNIQKLIYFDPDIFIYSGCEKIFRLLDDHSVIVTPHTTQPFVDEKDPSDLLFLKTGVYNLGFIAVSRDNHVAALLDWWGIRCQSHGFVDTESGLFVDQKWAEYFPCFCDSLCILKDAGCNVAYWNLHYRSVTSRDSVYFVNETDTLVFFHFSGLQINNPEIVSKHQNRFRLSERKDLQPLFAEYIDILRRFNIEQCLSAGYKFDHYSNGVPISTIARRLFHSQRDRFQGSDPFDHEQPFYKWSTMWGINGKTSENPNGITDASRGDKKRGLLFTVIRHLPRIVGLKNYLLFLRTCAYVGKLSNQKNIFVYKRNP